MNLISWDACEIISFFIPNVNITEENHKTIQININWDSLYAQRMNKTKYAIASLTSFTQPKILSNIIKS